MKYFYVESIPHDAVIVDVFIEEVSKQVLDDYKQGWHFEKDGFNLILSMDSPSKNNGKWSCIRGKKTVGKNIYALPFIKYPGVLCMLLVSKKEFFKYSKRGSEKREQTSFERLRDVFWGKMNSGKVTEQQLVDHYMENNGVIIPDKL